jgi:acyl-CoA thioester hydrolase
MEKASSPPSREFNLPIRVYYEDTDAGGVVYYASYLRFAERARTELMRAVTRREGPLWTASDPLFVVRHLEADYKAPARLDDCLTVTTEVLKIGGASLDLLQTVKRGEETLVAIKVTLVCTTHDGKVLRLPPDWRQTFTRLITA